MSLVNPSEIKKILLQNCENHIQDRYKRIRERFIDLEEALLSETKSSAGDKHETGRAMIQLEQEKSGSQMNEVLEIKKVIERIDPNTTKDFIRIGSLIYTDQLNYFIAISIGKILIKKEPLFIIALNSPIGKLLLGKKAGESFVFRNQEIKILKVF